MANNGLDVSIGSVSIEDKVDTPSDGEVMAALPHDMTIGYSEDQGEYNADSILPDITNPGGAKVEAVLQSVSKAVDLDVDLISLTDKFFEIGGNSVKSIIALQTLRRYGYELDIEEFYTADTLQDIVNLVRDTSLTAAFAVNGIDVKLLESYSKPTKLEDYKILPLSEAAPEIKRASRDICIESILWSDGLNVAMKLDMKRKAITTFVKKLFHHEIYHPFSFLVINTKEDRVAAVVVNVDFYGDEVPVLGSAAPSRTPALEAMLNFKRELIADAKEALRVDTPGKWLFQVMSPINRDEPLDIKAPLLKLMEHEKASYAARNNFGGVIGLYNNVMGQWVAAQSGLQVVIRSPTRCGLGCSGLEYFKYNNRDDLQLYVMAKVISDKESIPSDLRTRIQMAVAGTQVPYEPLCMDKPLSSLTEDDIVHVVRNMRRFGVDVGVEDLSRGQTLESVSSSCRATRPPLFTLVSGMRTGMLQAESNVDFLERYGYECMPLRAASSAEKNDIVDLCVDFLLHNEPLVVCLELDMAVKRIFASAAIAEVMYSPACQPLSFFLRDKNGHVVGVMLCGDLFYQCYPSYEGIACLPWQSYINTMVTMEIYYKCILDATSPGKWACQVLTAVRSSEGLHSKAQIMKFLLSESIRLSRSQDFKHVFGLHTGLVSQEMATESGMEVIASSFPVRNVKFKGEKYFTNVTPKDAKIKVMARDFKS